MGQLKTEAECVEAGKAYMDTVTGQFLMPGYGTEENPYSLTTPGQATWTSPKVMEMPYTPTIDFTKKAFETHKLTGDPVLDSTARKKQVPGCHSY